MNTSLQHATVNQIQGVDKVEQSTPPDDPSGDQISCEKEATT